jgi:G:T/U-mismatch repair DNA glycosylase
MSFKSPDKYEIESHPFKIFVAPDTKFLVIGTFPTYKDNYKDTYDFFYAGAKNSFWKIIEQVFNQTFRYNKGNKAIEERQALLREKKIGLTDMHQKCYRKNQMSGDEYLFPIETLNIFSLLDQYTSIESLILTSRTDAIGALGLLKTYFLQNGLELEEMKRRNDKILEGNFNHNGKNINIFVPYSPSSRVTANFDEVVKMYSICLK